jgi:hypothetical protein
MIGAARMDFVLTELGDTITKIQKFSTASGEQMPIAGE